MPSFGLLDEISYRISYAFFLGQGPVRDGNESGRDIGGDVLRLGFDDGRAVSEPPPRSRHRCVARSSLREWM